MRDDELCCLTAPTYLMMGEYEAAFNPQKVIQKARAILPNLIKTELIPGVGHGMIGEDPETVNQHLIDFLLEQE